MKAEKILKILSYAVVSSLSVLITVILFVISNKDDVELVPGNNTVYIGETDISEYTLYYSGFKAKPAADRFHDIIFELTGNDLKVSRGYEQGKAIDFVVTDADIEISITNGTVSISAGSEEDVVKTVNIFANTYLGYMFAGEDREQIAFADEIVNVPDSVVPVHASQAWMPEREPIICLWKTNIARGQYYNTDAALASEIMTYSDKQLYEYIKMMKFCGFTGIQVTDMCSTWAVYGGYQFVHDRIRFMADSAHSLGMKFTLWVWGAEFTGYGWYDPTVKYHDDSSVYAYNCKEAVETFDKYYSIYAELADCSDRVLGHFDDPTQIFDSSEVGYFSKMLRDKMRAVNPDIDFGVSDYTNKYDKYVLSGYLGEDFTLYCGPSSSRLSDWTDFRHLANNINVNLGVWSWNLVEMEIDQMAEMDVNAKIIKETYLRTREDDAICKPVYWSEMESYHIANIFSLYTAGQLLINPERDTNELLMEIAEAVAGDIHANDLYEILTIIQDARSGESMEEFRIGSDSYIRTSDEYPFDDISARCHKYYPILEKMIEDNSCYSVIPLPVDTVALLRIVRTHLKQIMEFADFRVNLDELYQSYAGMADNKEFDDYALSESVLKLYKSVPNYDALIGTWGQPEAVSQYKLLDEFCNMVGIEMPKDPVYIYYRKQYMIEEMMTLQKNSPTCLYFPNYGGHFWPFIYGEEASIELVDALVEDGLLIRTEDDTVYLANWENYVFFGSAAYMYNK